MDQIELAAEILAQLKQIKWMLVFVLSIFFLGLVGILILIRLTRKAMDEEPFINSFKDRASALLDKDDLEGVISVSQEKLKAYPKNMYAHWYLAQAYFRREEYAKALEALTTISENAPSWKDHYVDPYIEEIQDRLQSTKPEIVRPDED